MENKKVFKCMIDNLEKEFEILYTFKSIKTNKDYIIYTDNLYDKNKKLNIYAAIYYPFDSEKELENIETDEDWKEIEDFLKKESGGIND